MSCDTLTFLDELDNIISLGDVIQDDDLLHIYNISLASSNDQNLTMVQLKNSYLGIDTINTNISNNSSAIITNASDITDLQNDKVDKDISNDTDYVPKTSFSGTEELFLDDNGTPSKTNMSTLINIVSNKYPPNHISGGIGTKSFNDEFVAMTSNTTPTGEECWATSQYSSSYAPWYAFNKTVSSSVDSWVSSAGGTQILLRKMTSINPLDTISITSRNISPSEYPTDFTLVYTTDDMSGYSNVDPTLTGISFTTVKTVTGETFTQAQTKYYELDSQVPTDATAWGIVITSVVTSYSVGRMDGYSGTEFGVDIDSSTSRSTDNLVDFNFDATSLDYSDNAKWKSGTAPTLTNATIHYFADNNSGSQQIIFDTSSSQDSRGRPIPDNITDSYRWLDSLTTDSNGNIKETRAFGYGKRVEKRYNNSLLDNSALSVTAQLINLSVPTGLIVGVIGGAKAGTSGGDGQVRFASGYKTTMDDNELEINMQDGGEAGSINLYGIKTNTSGQIWKRSESGTALSLVYTSGYIIER